jgi:hypothetical protein
LDAGDAASEKSCFDEVTVNVTVALWLTLPLAAVTVIVEVPAGVELAVVTVSVEEPDVTIDAGLNLAVAPLGKPLALSEAVPLKPFTADTVTV